MTKSHSQETISSGTTSDRIDRLPNEILSEIFLCVHDLVEDEMDKELAGPPPCAFLSHVCQRWRDVAISCQQLWSHLPRDTQEWTRTCLARAHSSPVDLRFDVWQALPRSILRQREAWQMITPAIPRATTLTVYAEPDRYEEAGEDVKFVFQGLAAHEAPLLEELKITLDPSYVWFEPALVLAPFKDKAPPKLRLIELDGCRLIPPLSIFSSSLRHITLGDTCIWSEVDDIIEFFQLVPLLESFTFTFAYPSDHDHGFSTAPSHKYPLRNVSLLKMDYLNLDASFAAILCIFDHLVLPVDTQLYLMPSDCESFALDSYTENELQRLMMRASASMRAHYEEDIEEGRYYKAVEISRASISARGCHLGIPSGLSDVPQLRRAAASMYLTIPVFADTQKLTIRGYDTEVFTMHDLACFKSVERLCLDGVASALFEAALRDVDPSSTGQLFPACTKIVIRDFDFVKWPGTSHYDYQVPEDFVERLAEVLLRRCQCMKEVVKIVFKKCTMRPATANLFKERLGTNCVFVA